MRIKGPAVRADTYSDGVGAEWLEDGVTPLAVTGVVLSVAGGGLAATSPTAGSSVDYAGIAALISSVAGLVAASGAILLGLRRRDNGVDAAAALEEIKKMIAKEEDDDEPPHHPRRRR